MLRIKFQSGAVRGLLLLMFVSLVASSAEAGEKSKSEVIEYRGGIKNSNGDYRLERKYLNLLIASLREKTGFAELHFDDADYLEIGNKENYVGGSNAARKLLLSALEGKILFKLENHDRSEKVNFAHLGESTIFRNMRTKQEIEVRPLVIDFFDYNHLIGDSDVRRSFDQGMNVLHELVHGVYDLRDAVEDPNELGECENFVNTIRHDLGLPERQFYIARIYSALQPTGTIIRQAKLQFMRTKEKNGHLKTETVFLSWDVGRVGLVKVDERLLANKAKGVKATAQNTLLAVP